MAKKQNYGMDFGKIIEGQQAAMNILNGIISPELEAQMSPEQKQIFEQARTATSPEKLAELRTTLEQVTKNI